MKKAIKLFFKLWRFVLYVVILNIVDLFIKVILDCRLKKDIQYTKANPKWHHWKTDEKRYGLTFERSEDARAFDNGIRIAVKDLTEGMCL